jgi:tetratricopeptide (TPR) repeat protein
MRLWAVLFASAPLFLGCANTALVRYEKIAKRAGSQNYLDAARMIRKDADALYGSRKEMLYNMDLGLLYHYAGRYDSSTIFLARAADRYDALFTRSVTNEAASLLVNDNTRPYRSRPYEMMWLRVIQAFNYLALENPDGARVEMRQAQILLDELRRTAGTGKNAYRDDPLYRGTAAVIYEVLGERDDAAISVYHAVKAYRDQHASVPPGVGAMACRLLNAADRPDDIRLLELDCPTPVLKKRAVDSNDGAGGTGEVIVVGMLGRSPAIGETSFQGTWIRDGLLVYSYKDPNGKTVTDALPAPGLPQSEASKAGSGRRTRSGTTFSVKWAMPSLREVPVQSRVLKIAPVSGVVGDSGVSGDPRGAAGQGPAGVVTGEVWGDTHELLERDLADNWNTVLLRTVTRVLIRTIATEKAKSEMRTDNPLLNLMTSLGTDFLSGQLEQADVRSWFLLPRTVQVARLTFPAGRQTVQIGAENASGGTVASETRTVQVRPGKTTFVFFNSLK